MSVGRYQSWGRLHRHKQQAQTLYWRDDPLPIKRDSGHSYLPFGNGRSYGDVCLNDGGFLLDCRHLDRIISFDTVNGVLRCEAGVLFAEVLELVVAQGWFLPVTPGTQFVTVGGAIANDVHGKNHHQVGTFGQHVTCFELLRSDGTRMLCSDDENPDYFGATIGGLGLTGVITWAEFRLRPIKTAFIDQEVIRYSDLDGFFYLARESNENYEHTVAWVDCLARGRQLGRGLFIRGNHATTTEGNVAAPSRRRLKVPMVPPVSLVNGPVLKLFNSLYYRKQVAERVSGLVHYQPFFYPLDAIEDWNRIYGPQGFFQHQCVLPAADMEGAVREILERIAVAGVGSFLATLKLFGDRPSPGLLSFPLPGVTLALDFPNRGERTRQLLDQLDRVVVAAGGRINPSKDACMAAQDFQRGYSNWQDMVRFVDSKMSSSFWRRVTGLES